MRINNRWIKPIAIMLCMVFVSLAQVHIQPSAQSSQNVSISILQDANATPANSTAVGKKPILAPDLKTALKWAEKLRKSLSPEWTITVKQFETDDGMKWGVQLT